MFGRRIQSPRARVWDNAVVVVVGASSGIGRTVAQMVGERGAQVVLVARSGQRLQGAAAELQQHGARVVPMPADVTDANQVKTLADEVRRRFGRVDCLIYSAGVLHLEPVASLDLELARASMDINYWGAVYTVRAFIPMLCRGEGKRIGLISSLSVPCTPPFFTAYAAPKHALHGFARCLQQELRPAGVRVSLILPGPVDTPLVAGKLHQPLYRLPPGIPVLTPEAAAKGVLRAVERGKRVAVIPRRLTWAAQVGFARPGWVERYCRWTIPGWDAELTNHLPREDGSCVTTWEPEG